MKPTDALRNAVAESDHVFEKKLKRPASLCMYCDGPSAERERFDSLLRPHRAQRLGLPMHGLAEMSLGHGSILVHENVRRFAWFVPPLLAATLEAGAFTAGMRRLAELAQEARVADSQADSSDSAAFTPSEQECLARFFAATLDALIHDDSLDGRELDAALLAGEGCAIKSLPLIEHWIAAGRAEPGARAECNLLTAIAWGSQHGDSATLRALGTEVVRAYLEERIFAETDPQQATALSAAESAVGDWLGACCRNH